MTSSVHQLDCKEHDYDIAAYCFGELAEQARDNFEIHLLNCSECWSEVERLNGAVHILQTERIVTRRARTPEVIGTLGMSGRLDQPLAGHTKFVAAACTAYA